MFPAVSLDGVTVNAPDALALARFYAALLGGTVRGDSSWAMTRGSRGTISFQRDPDLRTKQWPVHPGAIHLDFAVDDVERASA